MADLIPMVAFRLFKGNSLSMGVGQLIYENSQPFASLVDPSSGEPFSPPRLIKLLPANLELLEDESAGRPALYYYRSGLVEPD
jgi:hypothetical protein